MLAIPMEVPRHDAPAAPKAPPCPDWIIEYDRESLVVESPRGRTYGIAFDVVDGDEVVRVTELDV